MREDPELIAACERQGLFLTLSIKAFVAQFGAISLLGSHSRLAPKGIEADPLEVGGPHTLEGALEHWTKVERKNRTSMLYEVIPIAESKLGMLDGELPLACLSIELPNAAADAVLVSEPKGRTLVEYLRWSFQWGRFPGWEHEKDRPEKEIALVREGLLPI